MCSILETAVLARVMSNYRFILWGVIPLLFFIVSIVLLLFVTQQNSKSQVRKEIHGLINVIDTLMSNGDDTAQRALLLAGRPCATVIETLRDLAGRYHLIRSVSLVDQNGLYCSPAPAMKDALAPVPANAKGAALSLQVGPAAAEIVLEQRLGQTRAVVIMDSHTLRAIITTLSPSRPVGLAIGDTLLTSSRRPERLFRSARKTRKSASLAAYRHAIPTDYRWRRRRGCPGVIFSLTPAI